MRIYFTLVKIAWSDSDATFRKTDSATGITFYSHCVGH